jgi:hypothetical protein
MDRVTELQRSIGQALDRAQHAMQTDQTTGKRDLERAEADLARLAAIANQVRGLTGGGVRAG